jgi:hypothetical protein
MQKTRAEIDDCLNMAAEQIEDGSKYPGMSYEEGIRAALEWVTGDVDEHPMEEDE